MTEKQTISERLEILIRELGLNPNSFSKALGYPNNNVTIGRIINDKEKAPSYETLQKIMSSFPQVNPSWLLTGESPMFREGIKEESQALSKDIVLIPLLPISAQGGSLNDFFVSVKRSDCEQIPSIIKGAEFGINVAGDSMAPEYPNGSQVLIKKINEKAFMEWGKVYVLDTCNGIVIKKIVPSENENCLRCISINPDPNYVPFDISKADIFGIYRVLMCMSVK
jgi:phage repressor protein C with HTH and peptisase S24 domain